MTDQRGWNKCDDCGRFANPEEMDYGEHISLTWGGYVHHEYWQVHKEGVGCKQLAEAVSDD